MPVDPVEIRFSGNKNITQYALPKMYRSSPAPDLKFTLLPSFMWYELNTVTTGNGVEVRREIKVDKCGSISAGEFKAWFNVICGDTTSDSIEIILNIEGKDAE